MNGLILLNANYTYEGNIANGEAHGKGMFNYVNGDRFVGECKYGKHDGFGKYYYKSGAVYTGFFSFGKLHGVGTFEDETNIYKGSWRGDRKHGMFYRTKKHAFETELQKWRKGKLVQTESVQYIQPAALQTIKENPLRFAKKYQITYKGNEKKCIGCCAKCANSTNDGCGHVVMCDECLGKCDRCPICRAPIGKLIRLFIS